MRDALPGVDARCHRAWSCVTRPEDGDTVGVASPHPAGRLRTRPPTVVSSSREPASGAAIAVATLENAAIPAELMGDSHGASAGSGWRARRGHGDGGGQLRWRSRGKRTRWLLVWVGVLRCGMGKSCQPTVRSAKPANGVAADPGAERGPG